MPAKAASRRLRQRAVRGGGADDERASRWVTPAPRDVLLGPLPTLAFAALAVTLAFVIPPGEAPDEPQHLAYVNFVVEHAALPNQNDEQMRVVGQGHQAPLYYVVAATLVRAVKGASPVQVVLAPNPEHRWHGGTRLDVPVHRDPGTSFPTPVDRGLFYGLRLLAVACGLATLVIVRRLAVLLLDGPVARTVAVLVVATLPQLVFVSAMVTADDLTMLLCALTGEAFVRRLLAPARLGEWAGVGGWLGLALLAKKTALFMVPATAVCMAWQAWRMPARRQELAAGAGALLATTAAVSGWIFVRSWLLYGEFLGTTMEKQTLPRLVYERSLWDPWFRTEFPRTFGASFVGVLGWMNLYLPDAVYAGYAALGVLAVVGVVRRTLAQRAGDAAVVVSSVFVAACLGGVVYYNMTFPQPQGRYLFAAIAFVAVLIGAGIGELVGEGAAARRVAVPALAVALLGADVALLHAVRSFYAGY